MNFWPLVNRHKHNKIISSNYVVLLPLFTANFTCRQTWIVLSGPGFKRAIIVQALRSISFQMCCTSLTSWDFSGWVKLRSHSWKQTEMMSAGLHRWDEAWRDAPGVPQWFHTVCTVLKWCCSVVEHVQQTASFPHQQLVTCTRGSAGINSWSWALFLTSSISESVLWTPDEGFYT